MSELPPRLLAGHASSENAPGAEEPEPSVTRIRFARVLEKKAACELSRCSPVAQSVEQLAVNQLVGGSSPSRGASFCEGMPSSSACGGKLHSATPLRRNKKL